jgi:hypothetical protein
VIKNEQSAYSIGNESQENVPEKEDEGNFGSIPDSQNHQGNAEGRGKEEKNKNV